MSFPGTVQLKPGWEKQVSSTKNRKLGTEGYMFPGRWFKYALAGEAVTVALVQTTITAIANHDLDLVMSAAAAAEATVVIPTLGATAATANEYADGFFIINDAGTEQGHQYLIKSHLAANASANLTINLDEEDGLVVALTTSEQVGLVHNDCFDFVVNPTTATDAPLGVSCVDWANNDYGWLQIKGMGMCTADATAPATGTPVGPSNATAGNVELVDFSATYDVIQLGVMRNTASVSTECAPIKWDIP